MTRACLMLAKGKGTDEPHLVAILQAQLVNRLMGGVMVTPWNVDELPNDWLDAFDALVWELPSMREGQAKINAKLAELRKPKK